MLTMSGRTMICAALVACLAAACASAPSIPAVGDVMVSPKDDMRLHLVPAGPFHMGNADGWAGQQPVHEVSLDSYWVDETEITNRMYGRCVMAGACSPPETVSSYTRDRYYLDQAYDEYPVVNVSWQDAITYCTWAGRELPSEAQWEKAARGTDGRIYPWGDSPPSESLLNTFEVSHLEDTVHVGSYPQGASPFGALDMAGNVWEWTADWFEVYPGGDPLASANFGQRYRVLRGGSFVDAADATARYHNDPELRSYDIGFRCVLLGIPQEG
jgi:serine/threonine-protein kinase